MRRLLFAVLFLTLSAAAFAATGDAGWPTLKTQIQKAEAPAGSALEKLIRANQDFSLLRAEEANDKIRIPLWLRVIWRKAHPEGTYLATDPTGGYPLVLKEVEEWMEKHPDLRPGRPEPDIAPRPVKTSGGTNLRVSGAPPSRAASPTSGSTTGTRRRSSAPRTTSAAAASRRSSSPPTAAPPGGRPACRCRPATPSTPIRPSTGPRTAPPGRPRSASTRPAPCSRCAPTSRPTAAPPGPSTPPSPAPRPTPTSR